MTKLTQFAKYSGCGNDFIIIELEEEVSLSPSLSPMAIQKLCHRNNGIGADGIVTLEGGKKAPYRMRIFNSDGSEAEMCGNGLRCLASYIFSKYPSKAHVVIETMHGIAEASIAKDGVTISMQLSDLKMATRTLSIGAEEITLHSLDTGVPHAVHFVKDLETPKFLKVASLIRHHETFMPKGTNVNFATLSTQQSLTIRTYERGVEGETLACGTGAIAVAIAAANVYGLSFPLTINTRSKEAIEIDFQSSSNTLTMTGPARKIFEGSFDRIIFNNVN